MAEGDSKKVVIKITKISNYTSWYKNDLNKQYFMEEQEHCFCTTLKGKIFIVPKTDCEIVPLVPELQGNGTTF